METCEIFLSKLASPEAIFNELTTKLASDSPLSLDSLSGFLMSCENERKYMVYISDENIENDTVNDVAEIFRQCDADNQHISVEILTDEFLNIIDEKARLTHYTKPRTLVHRDGDLHPTVHIWLIKRKDMGIYVLLQKRASKKTIHPDCFDVSAAGHVSQGEEFRHAAIKEVREELGLDIPGNKLELIGLRNDVYREPGICDNEMSAVYLYRGKVDIDKLMLRSSEVSEVCWAEIDELLSIMQNEDIPNCISLDELAMIKKAVF